MSWGTRPHCGFTQLPSADCFKCRKRLDRPGPREAEGAPKEPALTSPSIRPYLILLGALALLVVSGVVVWSTRSPTPVAVTATSSAAAPASWALDLTGRWEAKSATTLAGSPPRPALREVFVETDRSGAIVSAGGTLTDPGRGGAGAGYLTVPDGGRRVRDAAAALAAAPRGASLSLEFVPLPAWIPARERTWRSVEGDHRSPEQAT